MLATAALEFEVPPELIATHAVEPRDSARMMVVRREGGAAEHRRVRDLGEYLRRGDVLVVNTTRVLPAWLQGRRADTGGWFHGLYLGPAPTPTVGPTGGPTRWVAMLSGRRLRAGVELVPRRGADDEQPDDSGVRLRLIERANDGSGGWIVEVADASGGVLSGTTEDVLARAGLTPIPPYIRKARKALGEPEDDARDRERYQTVFAEQASGRTMGRASIGSVAAPTAGMHLTHALLDSLGALGVERVDVVLHVGPGTFKPVEAAHVEEHRMHAEWCSMREEACRTVRAARERGGRVIAVGSTAARTLETYAAAEPPHLDWRETRLLVTPGYPWRWADGLLTNFHLPRTTLLAMTASLVTGGVERLLALYAEAIRERYRFFSYGDAMLIVA